MIKSICSLPDYAALKKLAFALWQQDSSYHGAAVMVGAGFSRSAASTGDASKKLPLWNNFSKTLAQALDSYSADPLRLAEEYCAYFGRQALTDLIKMEINDVAWEPGELHKSLLELPWSEVLTTNWDTLLERAAPQVHLPVYSLVSKQEDLSSARSPRIVKLHGTIDITKELIFTQEDYRKYPQNHAAFVNFARQVFIENELCLLGFSGDDPNFLQWAGWVRDHLATHSRRIYLVGALGLSAAKRKYLESINVAPIDLDGVVADHDDHDTKHLEATKIFIQALQNLKPKQVWDWAPTPLYRTTTTTEESTKTHQDVGYAAKLLHDKIPILEKDRLSYPGWLICPYPERLQLREQISDPWPNPKNLSAMATTEKIKLLYEIAWHHKVTFEALPPWLADELLTICDPYQPCALTKKQQLEIALLLLKNTRWMDSSDAKSISLKTRAILEKGKKYYPESSNELAYYDAIVVRDKFDYAALEECIDKIECSDSIWKLRKASLLAELGQYDRGKNLVAEAYQELLWQCRNDRNSIHVLSRLAWAHWFMRGVDLSSFSKEFKSFPSYYRDSKCDPWEHIEHIRERISKDIDRQQKQNEIKPSFEPGRYRDNSTTITFSNELHSLLLLDGVSAAAGMPLRWNGVSFLVEHAARLAELEGVDNHHRFALAVRSADSDTSDVLGKVFSRVQVACFPEEDVKFLLDQCTQAINYWKEKPKEKSRETRHHAISRLRIFIEVLARVSVRAAPEQAKQIFLLAVSLGKLPELHHVWLFNSIKRLVKFSLKSIPQSQQQDILLDALSFPLQTEINVSEHDDWVNPVVGHPGKRKEDAALDRRIDELIDRIAPCSSQSAPALLRFLPLIDTDFLTIGELQKIKDKLWGENSDQHRLPETGLLKYVLLKLPAQSPSEVRILVRRYLFEATGLNLFDRELLVDIANAAREKDIQELPSEEQAVNYFQRLVEWRQKKEEDVFELFRYEERALAGLIGEVLARSVVPALPIEAFTEENFQKMCAFYSEVEAPAVLMAFPYFAAADDVFIDRVERLLRQGLQSQDGNKVACSSHALLRWRDLKESPAIGRLILRLIHLIGSSRMTGLSALLWTADQMCRKHYLSEESIESLVEMLPIIFDSANYQNIKPSSQEAISVSFVRAACVRLARHVIDNNKDRDGELLRIVEDAKRDALPEVRFAEIIKE